MIALDSDYIKIAVPNKGRLHEPCIDLLKSAGYKFRVKDRALYATCTNAPLQIIFVRAADIPTLVSNGVVELGITGQDLVIETKSECDEVLPLDLGRCKLCVAVKADINSDSLSFLEGKTVATSFPYITSEFFKEKNVSVRCLELSGALEVMVGLGLAEAIVDIVETGDTLRENNLKVFSQIGSYETALIAGKGLASREEIEVIKKRLEGVIIAKRYSLLEYNIAKDNLKKAEEITPGIESPTLSPLDEEGWVAVEVMVEKSKIVDCMDALQVIGATGIIETEIKNCRL